MKKSTKQGITAKDAILKHINDKNITKNSLAKKLFKQYPKLFKSVESARSSIRYYTGTIGNLNRERAINAGHSDSLGTINNYKYLIGELPQSIREPKIPHYLSTKPQGSKGIVISDIHMGYHIEEQIAQIIHYGRLKDIDILIINGDLMDNHDISRWEKDPTKRTFWWEIQETKKLLKLLRYYFPSAQIVINEGNHDSRYRQYIWQHAPALADVEGLDLEILIGCPEYNITYYKGGRGIKLIDYTIYHGHELKCGGGKYPAKNVLLNTRTNTIVGHFHKTDYAQFKDANGKITCCHAVGSLSDNNPDYNPITNGYNNGFLYFETTPKGLSIQNWNLETDTLI